MSAAAARLVSESPVAFRREFTGEDWTAMRAAEQFLRERGFSFGPVQFGSLSSFVRRRLSRARTVVLL